MPNNSNSQGFFNVCMSLVKGVATFIMDGVKSTHKEGYVFIFISIAVTVLSYWLSSFLGTIFFIVTVWMVYFFRDPIRVVPQREGILVAPADGQITAVVESESLPDELVNKSDKKFTRVSIFLNVFNVHVNRLPVKCSVEEVKYIEGKFLNASLDKSSKENERNIMLLKTDDGDLLGLTQIAGLIAKRIVSYAKTGDNYKSGDRYGIIRFGSRVDLYIPNSYNVIVECGQTMIGGETVIASK
ncbi:MAG: phosphatidylserine decarboxylase [Candidatus Deianiraeaceae bacterium]|jgi:phosphatidylserine decarboxylase